MHGTRRNLLIVDDEPATRTSLTTIFTQLGHSVRAAEDGFSALGEIRQEVPDVILSDLNMPGMSGFEFLSVVRRRFPAVPVIAMSGAFSGEGVQPGVAADAFYEKGTSFSSLLGTMQIMTGEPTLVRDSGVPPPIWIAGTVAGASGEQSVTISCPECLRAFNQPLGQTVIQETSCLYCRSDIRYAVVQAINQASPEKFQHKPVAAAC